MITYYKVGGCVRDEILGIRSKDIDYAVENATYDEMRADILYTRNGTIFQERPEFLSIRARIPETGPADFTLCRIDGFYSDARHPDEVHVGNIYQDLSRRDFTVNAIAKNEATGEWIDPYNGRIDLEKNLLRCVGNAEDRFTEDPLRLLRAIRFHIVRGFELDAEIYYLLGHSVFPQKLYDVTRERIYEELKKCFEHDSWKTLMFFRERPYLEQIIFKNGLKLLVQIP